MCTRSLTIESSNDGFTIKHKNDFLSFDGQTFSYSETPKTFSPEEVKSLYEKLNLDSEGLSLQDLAKEVGRQACDKLNEATVH